MDASNTAAQKVDDAPRPEPMLSSFSTSLIEHGSTPLVEKPSDDFLHSKSNIEPTHLLKVEGTSKPEPMLSIPDTTHLDEEGITPLLELPFYHLQLSKAHVGPTYQMSFPPSLDSRLPSTTVPAIIKCFGKTWEVKFCGDTTPKGFDSSWRKFVDDNNLVVGDALIFELLEISFVKVMFKVQFLRCAIPPDVLEVINKSRAERQVITIDDE
ncbi:unnamed protein product [Fraxinus pennsylvanica]|uniref:TF-B3 domain-containing protein n=1 Tax=Fraxinus pennsylvanica TaxID=56036 RepID=A0AAD1ZHV1_9LAMI|nr:unnamed protein product [Fraxinus pennsylvanica]